MKTLEEVVKFLEEQGFRKYHQECNTHYDVGYILCKTFKDYCVPDCQCNNAPPQIVITPYQFIFGDGRRHEAFELELTGEDSSAMWPHIKYCLQPDEIEEKLDSTISKMYSSWKHLF